MLVANPDSPQQRHHRAPAGEAGLDQVHRNECGSVIPRRMYRGAEYNGQQDKDPGNET